ncbi:MAG: isoprenylcysteine carboxylmethyltransferase family protein [Melioribacteraceae bacterium]|nr:isoprenylcysteine carboxylmethyltransferase family protein [Melioribacteraceae bacterium]
MLFDLLIIVLLFLLFGITHTITASSELKKRLVEKIGDKIAFYRLFFNFSSLIIFVAIYELSPKPDDVIYDLIFPYDIVMFVIQIFCVFGLLWTLKYIDGKEFLGISQIKRYVNGSYDTTELDEHKTLVIKGPYKFSRHPVYLFSIVFLLARPTMDIFYAVFLSCIIIYFYIGSIYEERKLIEQFGETYVNYRNNVSRIFPIKTFLK